MIPLGILAASGGAALFGSYDLIATANGTGSSGIIEFNSILADYEHLQIRYTAKNTSSSVDINVRMNGATGTVYARHSLLGNGSTASSTAVSSETSIQMVDSMASSTTTGLTSSGVIDILDYKNTSKNTTLRALYGQTGNINRIFLTSGLYNATTAVTSLDLIAASGNFASISRFSLYGIRSA